MEKQLVCLWRACSRSGRSYRAAKTINGAAVEISRALRPLERHAGGSRAQGRQRSLIKNKLDALDSFDCTRWCKGGNDKAEMMCRPDRNEVCPAKGRLLVHRPTRTSRVNGLALAFEARSPAAISEGCPGLRSDRDRQRSTKGW